jgi:hypothetical protein
VSGRVTLEQTVFGQLPAFLVSQMGKELSMRGVILWLLGVPISIIILLYLFNVL